MTPDQLYYLIISNQHDKDKCINAITAFALNEQIEGIKASNKANQLFRYIDKDNLTFRLDRETCKTRRGKPRESFEEFDTT